MTVAQNVIDKCGGVEATARIVGKTSNWVYRWTYPRERGGTGGRVPADAQLAILEAAHRGEVDVKPADFFPVLTGAKTNA